MEKSYLYRRHNVYWVRVRVPDKVRDIVGKAQLSKNLYTTDLAEANRKKHIVIAKLKQLIHLANSKHMSPKYNYQNLQEPKIEKSLKFD